MLKTEADPVATVNLVFQRMLSEHVVDGIMVAAKTLYSPLPMPTLFTDIEKMKGVDPLAPVAPFNAARQAASFLKHPTGKRVALVLRPCEIRALIELVKLKQCDLQDVVLIGLECLGRMENDVFMKQAAQHPDLTCSFYHKPDLQSLVCQACKVCTHFQPQGADLVICTFGSALTETVSLVSQTETGSQIMNRLGLNTTGEPSERQTPIEQLLHARLQARKVFLESTSQKINTLEKFQNLIAHCLNCYNCRVACPVCYCKECVFVTDVFEHEPEVLLRRADKKGRIKLPIDTTMFHMTRLAHMSHACVSCGHCSSVCPSDILVADIFSTVAAETQSLYNYEPGRDVAEPIPLLVFEETTPERINGSTKEAN